MNIVGLMLAQGGGFGCSTISRKISWNVFREMVAAAI
jgi:hypothetical protein